MKVQNLNLLQTCPFDDYLKMPGWSYSGIRNDGRPFNAPTTKMQLGTHVHNYLLTPEAYSYDDIELVRPIAQKLKERLGVLLKYMLPEVVATAYFCHEGFVMPYKGRLDLTIPKRIVIDLKVSEMPIQRAVQHFGYNYQLSGYALAVGAPVALIMSIHPKTKDISIFNVPINSQWWEYQILSRGEVI